MRHAPGFVEITSPALILRADLPPIPTMTSNSTPRSHLPSTQTITTWPILLLILFSFCLTNSNTLPQTTDSDLCFTENELKGTTYHLKDIFIGKCWLFQTKIAPDRVWYVDTDYTNTILFCFPIKCDLYVIVIKNELPSRDHLNCT